MVSLNAAGIQLIVYDFDGVMTNNTVIVNEMGLESVIVHRGDGLAISKLKDMGIQQIILSSEKNGVVSQRGKKLGIPVIQGAQNKLVLLKDFLRERGIDRKKVLYVGNDENDLECIRYVGLSACPKDAEREVCDACGLVINRSGGDGVVRELYRLILADTYGQAS